MAGLRALGASTAVQAGGARTPAGASEACKCGIRKLTMMVIFHCSSYTCCSTALQMQQCQRDSMKRHSLTYTLGNPGSLLGAWRC